jgi:hypothetical protein
MSVKKIFALLLFAIFISLASCGNSDAIDSTPIFIQNAPPNLPQENAAPEQEASELCDCGERNANELRWCTQPVNIRESWEVDDDFLEGFENIHTRTYLQWDAEFPETLIIWSSEPLRDFSFVSVNSNAICCAYVGETLLTVDELHPTDAVALTVAFAHYLYPRGGIIFTDANDMRHHMFIQESMEGGCVPQYHLVYTNNLIDLRENWIDLEIISIPKAFSYEKDIFNYDFFITTCCTFVPSEDVSDAPKMWAGYLQNESVEEMTERSLTASEFLFDDGNIGHMFEFTDYILWVNDFQAVSFTHGGHRSLFEIHEDLILSIARTLTPRYATLPSVYTAEQIETAMQQQFVVAGLENSKVISVQRVENHREYFWHEPAEEYIDLSNTSCYRVHIQNSEYGTFTQYYYFRDDNGSPVLAFILC